MRKMTCEDPKPLSLNEMTLPPARIDQVLTLGPNFLYNLISKILGFNLQKVSLPEGLMGKDKIPDYLLHEFHNIPNGYYSNQFARGYSKGFNLFMLGEMGRIRKEMALEFSGCRSILDLGCGDGSSTKTLAEEGINDVWGLDPSPYLLGQAVQRYEGINFVHGLAESTEFSDNRFDGACACWVLHEIPSKVSDQILKECFRILKPGAKLVIIEPSKHQFRGKYLKLLKDYGLKGVYYRILATHAHEPYIDEWQNKNIATWAADHGFTLISNTNRMPEEKIVLKKPL